MHSSAHSEAEQDADGIGLTIINIGLSAAQQAALSQMLSRSPPPAVTVLKIMQTSHKRNHL